MILTIISLIVLINSQHAHSKVIKINTTGGSDNTTCCVDGECVCTSLSTALLYMTSNTVINITSESITLEGNIKMGSGDLNNITITGNGATIFCNNNGSLHCEYCSDVIIDGITWDRCGDPNGTNIAGVVFNITRNTSLQNCVFQHSSIPVICLLEASRRVVLENCNFTSNNLQTIYYHHSFILTPLSIASDGANDLNISISNCNIYNNRFWQGPFPNQTSLHIQLSDTYFAAKYLILIDNTNISYNLGGVYIELHNVLWIDIKFKRVYFSFNKMNSLFDGIVGGIAIMGHQISYNSSHTVTISQSTFSSNLGINVVCYLGGKHTEISVIDSVFLYNVPSSVMDIVSFASLIKIHFSNVLVLNNSNKYFGNEAVITIERQYGDMDINFFNVKVNSNYLKWFHDDKSVVIYVRSIIYVRSTSTGKTFFFMINCEFVDNRYHKNSAVIHVDVSAASDVNFITITNTQFQNNAGGTSIVHISVHSIIVHNPIDKVVVVPVTKVNLIIQNTNFINNSGSALYLDHCHLYLEGKIMFINNTADNGAAIYMKDGSTANFQRNSMVYFIHNTALLYGGAIYFIYESDFSLRYYSAFKTFTTNIYFTNNTADIAGNSLYLYIPNTFKEHNLPSDLMAIMNVPCQWNYCQLVGGDLTNVTCDYDYTLLRGAPFPVVTSPHKLKLYFINSEGVNASHNSDHNIYFVKNNVLGRKILFNGAVFDYFGKPAEPTQFTIKCTNCSKFILSSDHLLVDNITSHSVIVTGSNFKVTNVNITIDVVSSIKNIITTLVIGLQPCTSHPGLVYCSISHSCACYNHSIINCHDTYNEVKRGYWFGTVAGIPTTSLCPNHYCNFVTHKETRQGYFELPNNIDGQCKTHRTGVACGECSSGYTLAYVSIDCISVQHCSAGMTVLVVVLTCLYWIGVVVGVFSLMYFNIQLSSGYLYGVIYYYSMVGVLLDNNPYISDSVFQFVSILSSFAQLNLKFLQQLCLMKGLSGIDQLFIQYVHAIAIALLTVMIVIAARCSARVSLFIRKCIIQVMCLLILLSYTSLASTSLQLLRPIKFTDFEKVYTYASPHIEYFHGRHTIYGTIAAVCTLVVLIGLPLFLLFERFINKRIAVKVMPLLDQFQSCFKNKYRWFSAYYLICRQVIMLVVFVGDTDYYNMLFYLQTTCVIIAMIHIWFLPYRDDVLNALDGLILLTMLLVVNINTFPFLQTITTEVSIILIIFPLCLLVFLIIVKKIYACAQGCRCHRDEYNYDFEEEEQLLNNYNNALR